MMGKHFISGKALDFMYDDNYDEFIVERARIMKEKLSSLFI